MKTTTGWPTITSGESEGDAFKNFYDDTRHSVGYVSQIAIRKHSLSKQGVLGGLTKRSYGSTTRDNYFRSTQTKSHREDARRCCFLREKGLVP